MPWWTVIYLKEKNDCKKTVCIGFICFYSTVDGGLRLLAL
jgi:hypothetical protein